MSNWSPELHIPSATQRRLGRAPGQDKRRGKTGFNQMGKQIARNRPDTALRITILKWPAVDDNIHDRY